MFLRLFNDGLTAGTEIKASSSHLCFFDGALTLPTWLILSGKCIIAVLTPPLPFGLAYFDSLRICGDATRAIGPMEHRVNGFCQLGALLGRQLSDSSAGVKSGFEKDFRTEVISNACKKGLVEKQVTEASSGKFFFTQSPRDVADSIAGLIEQVGTELFDVGMLLYFKWG